MKNMVLSVFLVGVLVAPRLAPAHCDTMDGPVIVAARQALASGDVTPVLRWVKAGDEAELRRAFDETITVRAMGPEAQALADRYFFETLVRIHRAGEGAPYTGLKDGAAEPVVAAADEALDQGSVEALVGEITHAVHAGIGKRFDRAMSAKKHADESVEAGREFVEAYVDYVHYVEGLHQVLGAAAAHHEGH